MILHADSISLRRRIRWLLILFLFAASIQWAGATTMAQTLDARVASVNGPALRRNNQRAFILSQGDLLNPGDEIDTRGGGRVVIELTDGSVVVIQPKSRIAIRDYRSVASLREMFRILVGRVRVRIAHYGGKPNPYRVNSPTASILVRGTEFDVAVEPSGDTRVAVYEGLVEVQSLSDPSRRALLSAGRGALVRPNEDIRFFTPGSRNRSNKRGARNDDAANANTNANGQAGARLDDAEVGLEAAGMSASPRTDDGLMERETSDETAAMSVARRTETEDDDLQRGVVPANTTTNVRTYLASDYERYVDSLAGLGWSLPLRRFAAFADSHFDSLDNPAYATDIVAIEGMVWLIPFFNKARGADLQSGSAGFPFSGNLIRPFDSGLLAQGDFFIPVDRARMVIGGAVAVGADRSQSLTLDLASASLISSFPAGDRISRYDSVSTETMSITGSLMAARRFGDDGRTSVGAGVELVSSGGDLRGQTSLANGAGALQTEDLKTEPQISRLRFRVGMTREFDGGHKLGLLYRHESAAADERDRSRLFNGMPLDLDSTRQKGQSSEVSFRLRGPGARRLFYGLEGSLLWGGSNGRIRRAALLDSTTRADAGSASVNFGLGFALRRTTVLSADFGFGLSRLKEERRENATGNPVEDRQERERFASGRLGLQTDVWRRSFISASAMAIGQTNTIDLSLFPDLFGRRLNSLGLAETDGRSRRNSTYLFSDFGGGWRFSPNLMGEYIFSINSDMGPPRHIFLLRYIFKREIRE
ncbi:MAG TPA: FecR domain-containing protein [Blastocatellia bacterium]|nr:FecR domain-containing protein [Blastocatellia bacterium]